jgi:hypothetical protein
MEAVELTRQSADALAVCWPTSMLERQCTLQTIMLLLLTKLEETLDDGTLSMELFPKWVPTLHS